jgi:hypothetical protein
MNDNDNDIMDQLLKGPLAPLSGMIASVNENIELEEEWEGKRDAVVAMVRAAADDFNKNQGVFCETPAEAGAETGVLIHRVTSMLAGGSNRGYLALLDLILLSFREDNYNADDMIAKWAKSRGVLDEDG